MVQERAVIDRDAYTEIGIKRDRRTGRHKSRHTVTQTGSKSRKRQYHHNLNNCYHHHIYHHHYNNNHSNSNINNNIHLPEMYILLVPDSIMPEENMALK